MHKIPFYKEGTKRMSIDWGKVRSGMPCPIFGRRNLRGVNMIDQIEDGLVVFSNP